MVRTTLMMTACAAILVGMPAGEEASAARGGGGGGRSAGGGASRSFSGGAGRGTIRYSGGSRAGASVARPAAPVARPAAPAARPSASVARPSTPIARTGAVGGAAISARPSNYGSMLTQPGRPTQLPAAGYGRVVGPGGGSAVVGRGPAGGAAGAVRGPGGNWAAGYRGPAGGAAVAVRGPYGYRSYVRLPSGAVRYPWHGTSYWHVGFTWYRPYYYGGQVYYCDVPPPVGYVTDDLPDDASQVVLGNATYYYYQNTYYVQKDGKYEVAPPPGGDADAAASAVDPKALDQLHRMADFLGAIKAGRFTIQNASDHILDSGQRVQVESSRAIAFREPDRFAVDYIGPDQNRRAVYDGKTITVLEKDQDVYAQEPMPPTLAETMDTLASKYGMAVPAAELLRPGLFDRLKGKIRSGEYVGLESVGGVNCHHLAFGQDWADVQLWVQDGDQPLPRKIEIAYKKIPGTPKYVMDLSSWNLSDPPDSAFALTVPPDAKKIDMAPMEKPE